MLLEIGVFSEAWICSIGVGHHAACQRGSEVMGRVEFRSPLRKLVAFFERSRDNWKEKCQRAKYDFKLLKRRLANLQRRYDTCQQSYQEAADQRDQMQARREHLQAQNEQLQARLDALVKKVPQNN